MRHCRRTTTVLTALAVAAGTLGAGTSVAATAPAPAPSFYDTPSTITGAPGDVIRAEPSSFYLDPLRVLPAPAAAERVMYVSTDRTGTKIAVTGTVLTPRAPWTGPGERPVVAYAVGTQGLGDQCAPSRQLDAGTEYEGTFITGLLARGYGITITDYQGLGTAGVHTYTSREVTGRAVLDSVRAAQRLPAANLPDHGPVALSGYSQGGGATAAAAEIAPTYSPELDLRGVVAGAVPADLGAVARNLDGSLYFSFLGYSLAGLSASYGVQLDGYLNARGRRVVAALEQQCTTDSIAAFPFVRSSSLTSDGRSATQLLATAPFRGIVADQRIGTRPPAVPVLVTHSLLDDVIPYAVGRNLATQWCGEGASVQMATNLAPTHVGGALGSYPASFAFLEARFAGVPAARGCTGL
ncbi:lipase family protein [Rhodococcus antarcticus]|uniref:Lipase family protein n=1 Tax=Rhodococcus antarcticus TaxID=2987751 RepID=A0ABY6NYW2_9NOCA|nr:lipase family protein [Rhodococcus antarcticus]UZJ24236.1 lipase family protein [Rhodococcus antarcticus]